MAMTDEQIERYYPPYYSKRSRRKRSEKLLKGKF